MGNLHLKESYSILAKFVKFSYICMGSEPSPILSAGGITPVYRTIRWTEHRFLVLQRALTWLERAMIFSLSWSRRTPYGFPGPVANIFGARDYPLSIFIFMLY
ncbi:hypothetical protein B7W85_23725 [Allorhizobium ampelinum]|nr:hypothetical protein B7W85_23725 [Allorhizobium ampelinum]